MNQPTEEQKAALAKLREPFPDHQISQLPKPTKKREEMDKLPKATCKVCGGYHATSNIIHLSYVGHAALTDRLLDADPLWYWEPLTFDNTGLPVIDRDGGMWIKLTVAGMTRLGYGDAQGKTGGDAMKERIGDALRNAAMRFGAALDLWHKGDLHIEDDTDTERQTKAKEKAQQGAKSAAQGTNDPAPEQPQGGVEMLTPGQRNMIFAKIKAMGADEGAVKEHFKIASINDLPKAKVNEALKFIEGK